MNEAPTSSAERVLQTTLQHVRREKSRRRRTRRAIAVAATVPALAMLLTWAAALRTPQPPGTTISHAVINAPEVQDTRTLAVLVVRDGTTTFEQRRANDLADLDLTFSLDPVIAQVR